MTIGSGMRLVHVEVSLILYIMSLSPLHYEESGGHSLCSICHRAEGRGANSKHIFLRRKNSNFPEGNLSFFSEENIVLYKSRPVGSR